MLGTKQSKAGMKLASYVSQKDLEDIQAMLDEADGHFIGNDAVKNMLAAAKSTNKDASADLQEEGWHQFEEYESYYWQHITIAYGNNTFHCYSKVKDKKDHPKPDSHVIGQVTYLSGNKLILRS